MSKVSIKTITSVDGNFFQDDGPKESFSKSFEVSFLITKNLNALQCVKKSKEKRLGKYDRLIASIQEVGGDFTLKLHKSMLISYSDTFWLVINKSSVPSYRITPGDVFRIEKYTYRVNVIVGLKPTKQITSESIKSTDLHKGNIGNSVKNPKRILVETGKDTDLYCRICLETEETEENPFVKPCLCIGSMGCIHQICFSKWVLSKFTITCYEHSQVITFPSLACETCMFAIPDTLFLPHKFEILSTLDIRRKHMVIEVLKKQNTASREIIIIYLDALENFQIKTTGEVKAFDGKNLAGVFEIRKHKICLSNTNKKNNTLVLAKNSILLEKQQKIRLVNGKSLIVLSVKKKFSFYKTFCFCRSKSR